MKPFIFDHWHAWPGQSGILLSDENTKTLRSFADADACTTWLFLSGFKPAARALNTHLKENAK